MIGGIGTTLAQTHDDPQARHRYDWFLPSSTHHRHGDQNHALRCLAENVLDFLVVSGAHRVLPIGAVGLRRTELIVTAESPAAALRPK
jgi:hypothetical protein